MKWTCLLILGLCGCGKVSKHDTTLSDLQEQNWQEAVRQGLVSTNNAPLTSSDRQRAVTHALAQWCITNIPNFLP